MAALGGYLRGLREGRHITRTGLAGDLGVDSTTLWRIEEGKQEPSGQLLLNLVAAVRGSYEDVRRLMSDNSASDETGRQLAEYRLSASERAQVRSFTDSLTPEEREELARRLANDPDFINSIIRAVVGNDRD